MRRKCTGKAKLPVYLIKRRVRSWTWLSGVISVKKQSGIVSFSIIEIVKWKRSIAYREAHGNIRKWNDDISVLPLSFYIGGFIINSVEKREKQGDLPWN